MGEYISKDAEGPGMPEIKAILENVPMMNFLSIRTFVAKFIGNVFGMIASLSIGNSGPVVHMTAIVTH
jgi:H+/Cl- antiporter ClcA